MCNWSVLFPSLVHSRVYLGESLVVWGEVMVEYDGVATVMVKWIFLKGHRRRQGMRRR